MAFTKKKLEFAVSLANGNFGSGGNSATIKDHRASVVIANAGGRDMGQAEVAIFGLPLSLMNQLTTLGSNVNLVSKNTISIRAGEEGGTMTEIFRGTISVAFADARAQPQVCLRISAFAGLMEAIKPVEPTTVKGSADAAQVMKGIADKAGLQFENNGVNIKLMNPYLPGSARAQALALARAAGFEAIIDKGTLAIWPAGQSRKGDTPVVSAQTGMVGYPTYTQGGIEVTTLFNPNIKPGGSIEVKSDLTPACGKWNVVNLVYELDAETPKGKWFDIITCTRVGGGGPS